jgi:nucleotide-binding universal stress UspA family protein
VVLGVSDDVRGSQRGLWDAVRWASRRRVDLKLVMAVPDRYRATDDPQADEQRRRALYLVNIAAHSAALHSDVGLRVHAAVVVGNPAQALIAESRTAGLVVVQRRELSAWSRIRAGSVTAVVAAQAHCPVLVVHASDLYPESHQPGDVLVAVDRQGHGGRAIPEAFKEASWRGVGLTAVHVRHPDAHGPTALADPHVEAELSKDVAEQLAGYAADYPDVPVRRLILSGEVVPMLLDAARQHDLVVVARHRDDRPRDRNLGSVTRHILAGARCPVLVTPPARAVIANGQRADSPGESSWSPGQV